MAGEGGEGGGVAGEVGESGKGLFHAFLQEGAGAIESVHGNGGIFFSRGIGACGFAKLGGGGGGVQNVVGNLKGFADGLAATATDVYKRQRLGVLRTHSGGSSMKLSRLA